MNRRLEFRLADQAQAAALMESVRPRAQHRSAYQRRAARHLQQKPLSETARSGFGKDSGDVPLTPAVAETPTNAQWTARSRDDSADTNDIEYADDDDQSLHASRMEIGSFVGERRLLMPHRLERADSQVCIYLEFSMRHKKIRWVLSDTRAECDFKFEVHLRELYELIHVEADLEGQAYWLTLDLMLPPKLYAGRYEFTEDVGMWEYTRKFGLVWHRVIQVDPCADVDFGQHLAFRFRLPCAENRDFIAQMVALNRQGLIANPTNFQQRMDVLYAPADGSYVDYRLDLTQAEHGGLKFSVYYALLSLVTSGLMSQYLLSPAFVERLAETNEQLARGALVCNYLRYEK